MTTSIRADSIRNEIELRFDNAPKPPDMSNFDAISVLEHTLAEQRNKSKKEYYIEKSKHPVASLVQPNKDHSYLAVPSEFLAYNSNFRQHLSLFNYQAPELLVTFQDFVFPTEASDVYALTLLLWESLNQVVPYVVYSKYELQCILANGEVFLPILEPHRCRHFVDLITLGLKSDLKNRNLTLDEFMDKLKYAKTQCDLDEIQTLNENHSSNVDYVNHSRNPSHFHESPVPERLCGNKTKLDVPSNSRESKKWTILNKTKNPHIPLVLNQSSSSTLSEFNQNINSQLNVNGQNEWTSTMKIPNDKITPRHISKKASVNLFKGSSDSLTNDPRGLKKRSQDLIRSNISPKSALSAEKSRFLNKLLEAPPSSSESLRRSNASPSVNNFLDATPIRQEMSTEHLRLHNNLTKSAPPSSYRFEIGDYELPDTPIARENKIRRNAWLSNQRLSNLSGDGDCETKSTNVPVQVRGIM